jgi:small subunit ribosomal protein S2
MNNVDDLVKELFDAGSHLGHKAQRVHPKAKKYIYKIENSVSIIDLTKTADLLAKAKNFVADLGKNNKVLLIVATKKIAATQIIELCQKNNVSYVAVKWPAGLITNFDMIMKNVKKLKTMKEEKESGAWDKYVKHEQVKLTKELNRLEKFYGGLVALEKLPDALFIVDIKKEKNAVKEAQERGITVVAVTDTNVDPDTVDFPIPANDDSLSSINFVTCKIVEAYVKEKK